MKVKTSITLSEDLLLAVDKLAGHHRSRSDFIETAVRDRLARLEWEEREERDLEILNREADRLNREAEDVLGYQVIP